MKIVVDTNIVFSALLNTNSRIGRLLLDARDKIEFYSCKYLQKEIYRHIDKIRQYSGLNSDDLFELISLTKSRIFFIDENLLPAPTIAKAQAWVSDVDFDDFAFVALAIHLNALLWTGDKKLVGGLLQKGYSHLITTTDLWRIAEENTRLY
ncbi:MAG: putative toxin-antitoxin system toxin component, PIN family [Prevotellaceae bacterium]|jgi:putative PIN family toxin of toxin-antitoxin system|nr:putative toxin-antitoxin system toxin component, PIN family [Prevotellaceae bacterium]